MEKLSDKVMDECHRLVEVFAENLPAVGVMEFDTVVTDLVEDITHKVKQDILIQVMGLLPQITKRAYFNKTCFDCIEKLKQELQ